MFNTKENPVAPLRVSMVQTDIVWQNAEANLTHYRELLAPLKGQSDLAVLPEMCANGFGSDIQQIAQPSDGLTMTTIRAMAIEFELAIAGSFACFDDGKYYNRGFFIYPDGYTVFYDKWHLFRMGGETDHTTAGKDAVIVTYKGWNIRLAICYDLRFPVWCRNRRLPVPNPTWLLEQEEPMDNPLEYDLMLFVANWPEGRKSSWSTMLLSRAMENHAYVCGVNRVGQDGLGLHYPGLSAMCNNRDYMAVLPENEECVETVTISLKRLLHSRSRFTAWMDCDEFTLD